MSRLSEILIKHREAQGLTQEQVADKIGKGLRTYQYYESADVTPKLDTLEKLSEILKFNLADMYSQPAIRVQEYAIGEEEEPYLVKRRSKKNSFRTNRTPVYNTKASAGHAIFFNDRPELIAEYVDIPFIGKSDGVIEIVGSSMSPTYLNGTRIAVRKLEDKQLIYPNECYYIIDANYDGRVKRLIKSEKEDHIILRSDNKEYPDVELPWSKIISVCKILCRIIKS